MSAERLTVAEYWALRNAAPGSRSTRGEWFEMGRVMADRLRGRGLLTVWDPDVEAGRRWVGVQITDAGCEALAAYRRAAR